MQDLDLARAVREVGASMNGQVRFELEDIDDVERDLAARALLYAACSGDFDQDEVDVLVELRERIRPASIRARGIMDLTRRYPPRRPEDMGDSDGLGR